MEYVYELDANGKLTYDNFQETHHTQGARHTAITRAPTDSPPEPRRRI